MQKKVTFIKFFIFCFLIIALLTYRDFLYTIKLMNYHFYNFKMLPLDPYYEIILKIQGLIDKSFRFPWEWRIIPNYINWIFYEILPCIEPKIIPSQMNNSTYCAIWSISVVNFISAIFSQILLSYYVLTKLKRDYIESIFLIFLSYFFIKFLDPFGVDKVSFLFLIIFLFFSQSRYSYFFILISIFVNDKCLLFITTYYFANSFDINKLDKMVKDYRFLLSLLICIGYLIFISEIIFKISISEVSYNYLNFHSLVNSILPSLIIVFGFLYNFNKRKILKNFNLKKSYILFIIAFSLLGIFVGGPGNFGRYIVFGSLFFIPILNYQLLVFIKKYIFKLK